MEGGSSNQEYIWEFLRLTYFSASYWKHVENMILKKMVEESNMLCHTVFFVKICFVPFSKLFHWFWLLLKKKGFPKGLEFVHRSNAFSILLSVCNWVRFFSENIIGSKQLPFSIHGATYRKLELVVKRD